MLTTAWAFIVHALNDVASILGVVGTLALVGGVLAAMLGFCYMVLIFGEKATHMFMPFLAESVKALLSESAKSHLAIKIEMRFQQFLGAIVVFCLLAYLLHASFPYVREGSEKAFLGTLITSSVLFIVILGVSIGLACRLK